jgi:uncharacterized DUF497 family protein
MSDDDFEWDDAKAASNLRRHRVSFASACEVFKDALAVGGVDDREDYGEDRFYIVGMVADRLLHVIYTLRNGTVRIISARAAEPHEKREYHEENS